MEDDDTDSVGGMDEVVTSVEETRTEGEAMKGWLEVMDAIIGPSGLAGPGAVSIVTSSDPSSDGRTGVPDGASDIDIAEGEADMVSLSSGGLSESVGVGAGS